NLAVIEPEQMEYSALHISIEGGEHRPLHIDIDVPSPAAACDQAAKLEHGQAADCRRCLARNECLELGRARFVEVPLCQCAGIEVEAAHRSSRSRRKTTSLPMASRGRVARSTACDGIRTGLSTGNRRAIGRP